MFALADACTVLVRVCLCVLEVLESHSQRELMHSPGTYPSKTHPRAVAPSDGDVLVVRSGGHCGDVSPRKKWLFDATQQTRSGEYYTAARLQHHFCN